MPPPGHQAFLLSLTARLAPSRLLPARAHGSGRGAPGPGEMAPLSGIHERAAARAAHQLRRYRRHLVRRLVGPARRRLAARSDLRADPPAPAEGAHRREPPPAAE